MIRMIKHNCETCAYYAAFEGICCNGDNHEWVGCWPPAPEKACKHWSENVETKHTEGKVDSENGA